MQGKGRRLGIDFGTSSTVAVLTQPDGRTLPVLFGETPLLPSAVCVDAGGVMLAGRDALYLGRSRPEHLEPNPKRRIDEGAVLLGDREVPVAELIAAVLRRVGEEAARVGGGPIAETMLTCPAGWAARRRAVLREAAELAGLGPVALVAEPVAAASYFVHVLGRDMPAGQCLVVYDFGAGTFDASVVRRIGDGFTVLAEEGIADAGGLDIDAAIVSYLGAVYAAGNPTAWARLTQPSTAADLRANRQLWQDVRDAKEMLSRSTATTIHVPLLDVDAPLGREQLEQLARPVLDRTVAATRAALRVSGAAAGEIAGVFLVGGSSRIPLATTLLHRALGMAPTAIEQPELIVAAGSLYAPQDAALPADPVGFPAAPAPPAPPAPLAPSAPPVASAPLAPSAPPVASAPPQPPAQPAAPPSAAEPVSAGPFTPVSAVPVSPVAAPVSPAAGLFGEGVTPAPAHRADPPMTPQAPISIDAGPLPPPPRPPARPGRGRQTAAAVAGAVAVLTVIVTVVLVIRANDKGPGSSAPPASSGSASHSSSAAAKPTVKVGLAFDIGGRGDKSFNDSAAAGLDRVKSVLNIEVKDLAAVASESENDKYSRLKLLCDSGYNPVIAVGFVYDGADPQNGPLAKAARGCPNTKFAIIDGGTQADNVAALTFAEEQGSYLVGVAAALKTRKGTVGFIGGCQVGLLEKFEAGFAAGAKATRPDIQVKVNYLSTPAEACRGFNDPAGGRTAASGMYDQGADIIYAAAGGSGTGVFEAAKANGGLAIGVDSDQYNTVTDTSLRPVILTSMLKRVDNAVFNFVKDVAGGRFKAGSTVLDLKADGVGYATSGGKVDDIKDELDAAKADIVSGKITVPSS